ncbi:MAG: DUF349 domain-containing protein [Dokdonella sp.]
MHDDTPELKSMLPVLAREDSDARVRLAVLRRLADPGVAQAMAHDDSDSDVRKAAESQWLELLSGTHASAPPLVERVRLLRAQDDLRLIEYIATRAPEAELRLAALERVTRPALIAERATGDIDAGIRMAALERVDDEAQLARIAERARKSDKQINRRAREKIDALRLARGDQATIHEHARSLCERLEGLIRDGGSVEAEAGIAHAWNEIASQVPADLVTRYSNATQLLALGRDPERVANMRERKALDGELGQLEKLLASATGSEHDLLSAQWEAIRERIMNLVVVDADAGASLTPRANTIQARLDSLQPPAIVVPDEEDAAAIAARVRFTAAVEALDAEREQEKARSRELNSTLAQCLDSIESSIEAGQTAEANQHYRHLRDLRKQLGDGIAASLRGRLVSVDKQYDDINQWQRWSDAQRRRQLCEEVAALPASGLHPDALATRVREAQAEWKRLDEIDGRGDAAGGGLTTRFRALCRDAIKPAKPYFDKRDELRKAKTEQLNALLLRLGGLVDDEAAAGNDLRELNSARREAASALRELDAVDPRERKALAQRLKDILGRFDSRIDAHYSGVEAAKNALISNADGLADQANVRDAISAARDLQQRWKAAGNGRRGRDEAQWKAFRAAIDTVFARADAERNERTSQDHALHAEASSLCAELEALATAETPPERTEQQRIDAAWNALSVADPALRERFSAAQLKLREAVERHSQQAQLSEYTTWEQHYALCRRIERGELSGDAASQAIAALPPLGIAGADMRARMDAALNGLPRDTASADALHNCLLQLEALAGIESPDEDRQRRMDLQVSRLSARMRGEHSANDDPTLRELLLNLTRLPAPSSEQTQFDARLGQAIQAAPKR